MRRAAGGATVMSPSVIDRAAEAAPALDFAAHPEVVRVVAEGERLAFGHLFNPAFATETSLIDPLPHQRIAVYEHLLAQARLRFLLADEPGPGKTIMAGPLHPRDAGPAARPPRPDRAACRPGRQLGARAGQAVRLSLPHRRRRATHAPATRSPALPAATRSSSASTPLPATASSPACRNRPSSPTTLSSSTSAHKLAADRQPDFTIRKTDRYRLAEALAGVPAERRAVVARLVAATTCCC